MAGRGGRPQISSGELRRGISVGMETPVRNLADLGQGGRGAWPGGLGELGQEGRAARPWRHGRPGRVAATTGDSMHLWLHRRRPIAAAIFTAPPQVAAP
jgi:hypothetical protein